MFVITVPDYMTIRELRQGMLADRLLLMHEYKLHGSVAFDRIYPSAQMAADDEGRDEFLEDLIEHMVKPVLPPI